MTIGLGLALLGVWLLPSAAMASKTVSSSGVWIAIAVAVGMTVYLA